MARRVVAEGTVSVDDCDSGRFYGCETSYSKLFVVKTNGSWVAKDRRCITNSDGLYHSGTLQDSLRGLCRVYTVWQFETYQELLKWLVE